MFIPWRNSRPAPSWAGTCCGGARPGIASGVNCDWLGAGEALGALVVPFMMIVLSVSHCLSRSVVYSRTNRETKLWEESDRRHFMLVQKLYS
uniref:Uncharacterized protein n=1 Tax=Colletotrichum scovillei TaxID=1209932 RepID=A0A9P7RED9_9PEZI